MDLVDTGWQEDKILGIVEEVQIHAALLLTPISGCIFPLHHGLILTFACLSDSNWLIKMRPKNTIGLLHLDT
jgi:hypothetical protein